MRQMSTKKSSSAKTPGKVNTVQVTKSDKDLSTAAYLGLSTLPKQEFYFLLLLVTPHSECHPSWQMCKALHRNTLHSSICKVLPWQKHCGMDKHATR